MNHRNTAEINKIQLGDLLQIKPRQTASRRTKNRIKENGDQFIFMKKTNSSSLFSSSTAFLLRSILENSSDGKGGRENWVGWLPLNEIELEEVVLPLTEEVTLVKI